MSDPPLIAVNGLLVSRGKPRLMLDNRYVTPLLAAGAVPLVVAAAGDDDYVNHLLGRVDGLMLTGGDDFDTERLGLGPTHPSALVTPPQKQDMDLQLTRLALERGLPLLGICYGMQLMGICAGAGLLQHLPEDRPACREHRDGIRHTVRVDSDSKLARALGVEREEVEVVSRHHQALVDAPEPWRVVARDEEGLVEAIELPELPFAVGVQWHPELSSPEDSQAGLFQALVQAAKAHSTHHRSPV